MKILFLLGWYYPDSVGGTEAYVRMLAEDLRSSGCEIAIAAPSVDEAERRYALDGLAVYRYPVSLAPTGAELRGDRPPRYFDVFTRWIENERPDLVHMHSLTRGCGFFHAKHVKDVGIPLVITTHVPEFTCPRGTLMRWGRIPCDGEMRTYRCSACRLHAKGLPRPMAWSLAYVPAWTTRWAGETNHRVASGLRSTPRIAQRHERVRELLRIADRIVVLTEWHRRVLLRNGVAVDRLTLSRHGVPERDIGEYRPASDRTDPDRVHIGYVGRLDPVKGVHVLVAAIGRLSPSSQVELRIYGRVNDAEGRAYLSNLRKLAGQDRRVVFAGEMTQENRFRVFGGLDALAVPSLWLETGPLVVLEAFAAGIPVLGSDLGGISESVVDGVSGLLVKAGSVAAWARALERIHELKVSRRWSWNIPPVRTSREIAKDMLDVYEDVRGSGKS